MKDAVRRAFLAFTSPLEGVVPWMYQDVKGLVSAGIGNLIDPVSLAIALPFVRLDGTSASREDIVAEWMRIKNLGPDAKGRTAAQLGHLYAKPHTRLRLTPEGIERVVMSKLEEMDRYLAKRFPEYPDWCADAQLATLSMAWACGPAFRFPKLEAALRARDFRTAAVECFMPEEAKISGLRPRNIANRVLYQNAAIVQNCLDPERLFYPADLESGPVDRDAPTLPAIPSRRPPVVSDFAVIHPPVPIRGFEEDDEPDPEAA